MQDETIIILEGLKTAIEAEANGANFYSMAAEKTSDPLGKQAFEILASEEKQHMEFLLAQYNVLSETGSLDTDLILGAQHDFETGQIFSEAIADRLQESQFEMSALSIGMQLEMSSITFYRSQADRVENPEIKKFYKELITWEQGHFDALYRQQQMLKEDFWASGGFASF